MEPMAAPRRRPARTVAECIAEPRHAGPLDGAARVGRAARDGRVVHIGVWSQDGVRRARFRATTCASLLAYAEVACEAIEAGAPADAVALRGLVRGVHPAHQDRAELVAAAVRAAFTEEGP
jgi:NifU-like protein involved in Fe-S cluster formation